MPQAIHVCNDVIWTTCGPYASTPHSYCSCSRDQRVRTRHLFLPDWILQRKDKSISSVLSSHHCGWSGPLSLCALPVPSRCLPTGAATQLHDSRKEVQILV